MWHSISNDSTIKKLNSSAETGLSNKEVQKRIKNNGYNILTEKKRKSLIIRFFEQFKDFMIITLIVAAIVQLVVSYLNGELDLIEPAIIIAIVVLNAFLGVFQEAKAEKSLDALKELSAPHANVLREGRKIEIDAKELVAGDIIYLEAGNFVPADGRLITSVNLKIDESSLTGESHPVEKFASKVLPEETLLGDRINMVMATGMVTYGRATAIVTETGMHTEVGSIAKMIMDDDTPMTPLQKRLADVGKILGIGALLICGLIFIIGTLQKRPVFDMFMTSVSLAVAAIPEGLPAIVTIMLSIGVQKMAKKNAVIRKLPAVETLGSATVIASDKTGTLTQNEMTVTEICSYRGKETQDSTFSDKLLTYGALCNDSNLEITNKKKGGLLKSTSSKVGKNSYGRQNKNGLIKNKKSSIIPNIIGDPTENALVMAAYNVGINKNDLENVAPRVYEIPFDSNRKQMTTVHQSENGNYVSITKGALDVVLEECKYVYQNGKITSINSSLKRKIENLNKDMSERALRVIAVTYKEISSDEMKKLNKKPTSGRNLEIESDLIFLGLLGMIDPPRPEVKGAVQTCKTAGIKPVMITGDHIITACAIAKEIGIMSKYDSDDTAISGAELNKMDDASLIANIHKYKVFARVTPEHKVRIVKAYQANDEVVAMTGDGVNDAPALNAADIGCAMGISGTDVAKNAADMVLTDDNFATIVSAVKEGRGIYDNIRKAIHFLLSCNIGELMTIFVAIVLHLPSPLKSIQLLWVNLVTDSLPAISLAVDPSDKDIMEKKPVSHKKGIFSDGLGVKIITEGLLVGSLSLCAYIIGIRLYDAHAIGLPFFGGESTVSIASKVEPVVGRTMAFCVLSISQLFHSFNMRSEHSLRHIGLFSNPQLVLSFIICGFLQVAVVSIEPLAKIFSVVPLNIAQWSIVLVLSFMPIVIVELQKSFNES